MKTIMILLILASTCCGQAPNPADANNTPRLRSLIEMAYVVGHSGAPGISKNDQELLKTLSLDAKKEFKAVSHLSEEAWSDAASPIFEKYNTEIKREIGKGSLKKLESLTLGNRVAKWGGSAIVWSKDIPAAVEFVKANPAGDWKANLDKAANGSRRSRDRSKFNGMVPAELKPLLGLE